MAPDVTALEEKKDEEDDAMVFIAGSQGSDKRTPSSYPRSNTPSTKDIRPRTESVRKKGIGSPGMVIPANVEEQIVLWEEELNLLKVTPGLLITNFDSLRQYQKFKANADIKRMELLCRNDSQQTVVVNPRYHALIYELIHKD